MRFRRKVHDGAGPVLGQQAGQQYAVADVAVDEDVTWIVVERGQRFQVARVSQLVQIQDSFTTLDQPVENKIRADEASASGDKDHGSLF